MMIHTTLKHLFPIFFATCFIAALTSCGGGGSGGGGTGTSSSSSTDSIPNAFTFAPVTNAAVSTEITSAPVTIGGINQSVSISISGGSYSIGGGAFTSATVTVTNGQVVTVKVKSSDKTNTPVTATLTVGGVSAAFTVTTVLDVTPDAFTFTPVTGAGAKAVTSSNEITVTGVDVAVPVSITNGEYSINGAAYTNAAGTVNKDQKITVRATSSDLPSTDVTAALIIGGVTGNFVVKTKADNAAPTAQILFPPPVSMTEGNTILVRGSASDEFSTIASVKVNGVTVTPKVAGNFSSWQVSIPLTTTSDNEVVVTTEDSVGNKSTNAAKVMVRQDDRKSAFPDADITLNGPWSIALDTLDGRNRLLVSTIQNGGYKVVSIDLATGKRSLFADSVQLYGLTIEPITKRLYGVDSDQLIYFDLSDAARHDVLLFSFDTAVYSLALDNSSSISKIGAAGNHKPELFTHDVSSSSYSILSSAESGVPNSENPLIKPYAMAFDKKNNRYLIANGGQDPDVNKHAIVAVNKTTGMRTVLSSNTVGTGDLFTSTLSDGDVNVINGIVVDEKNNRAIVNEMRGGIFTVDLTSGNRKLLSNSFGPESLNPTLTMSSLALAESGAYVFAVDQAYLVVYAVDLETGERVAFSKSATDY